MNPTAYSTPTSAIATSEDTGLIIRDRAEALASNPQLAAQNSAFEVMKQRALILLNSGLLPDSIKKWQQAAAIMMRAEELDVDYWTGLMHLNAIKGAPQPDGQLCMALIQRSELMERYEILETTDQRCVIRMKRYGQPAFDVTCTFQEYEKVAGPDGRRQAKTHLFWYTYKQGARRLFSDVLNNMQPKSQARRVIIGDDLPDDLPDDGVYVIEEGEGQPTATVPLSAAPSVGNDGSANGASANPVVLDMQALQALALSEGVADNEFHFANLLKQLLADGTITETSTAERVAEAMRGHKAEKEQREQEQDAPIEFEAIGSLNMESLWLRSHVNPRPEFNRTIQALRQTRQITDTMTADQVLAAIKKLLADKEFEALGGAS